MRYELRYQTKQDKEQRANVGGGRKEKSHSTYLSFSTTHEKYC